MNTFTELFGKNLLDEMQATDDARIWRRSCAKLLIGAGEKLFGDVNSFIHVLHEDL